MAYPSYTNGKPTNGANPYIDSLVLGQIWVGKVTYAFGPANVNIDINGDGGIDYGPSKVWSEQEKGIFQKVFSSYSAVCNIAFEEKAYTDYHNITEWSVSSMSEVGSSFTLFGQHKFPMSRGQSEGVYATDIKYWGTSAGSTGYSTVVHELGHAIGLAHPHDGGIYPDQVFPGVSKSQGDFGDFELNQGIWTVMSYNHGWKDVETPMPSDYGDVITPMALDIAALQKIYGVNNNYNTGSQTYTLPTSNVAGTGWSCIWDAGGIDAISATNANEGCVINLKAATLSGQNAGGFVSYVNGIVGGFTIANGVTIENAYGGNGNDKIDGNELNNIIMSGNGNDSIFGWMGDDTIDGGNGFDVANYSYNASNYHIIKTEDTFTVKSMIPSSDGTDIVKDIEQLKFTDYTLVLNQISEIATSIYQIYQAAFGRMPDNAGFNYWATLADEKGLSALDVAKSFAASPEFTQKFGLPSGAALTINSNSDYINKLYTNVLGRMPDSVGHDYWLKQADAGRSYEQLLVDFATSSENVDLTGLHTMDHIYWTV